MKTFIQILFFFLLVTQICFAQWYQQNSGALYDLPLVSVHFEDANNGWAVGGGCYEIPCFREILKTIDGGSTWISQIDYPEACPLKSVYFTDYNNGWAVGDCESIIKTTNGGIDWTEQTFGTFYYLNDVRFTDSNNGWVVGGNWVDSLHTYIPIILNTTNGGTDWTPQETSTYGELYGVFFTDSNNGWVVGGNGTILRTTNGGTIWQEQSSGTEEGLSGVTFTDLNNGWVVGGNGTILRTTNGGTTWQEQSSGTEEGLSGVTFTDLNNGTAVGWDGGNNLGLILRTTNGGTDWLDQNSYSNNPLYDIFFTDVQTGWIVGYNGTILHTTNGGVTFVEEEEIDEVPAEFLLLNNYPNPFNPSTKIKYSIPQSSKVVLKVFDVLGNEIETLINEEKPTGTYEVTWNAANLTSGVYFYQLKAGEFISVRKMILLK